MLAHLSLFSSAEEIASAFDITPPREYQPQYNIAPGGRCVVQWRMSVDGGPFCDLMRWGLLPRRNGAESSHCFVPGDVHDGRFPEVFSHCRCLVPVNGFFLVAPRLPESPGNGARVFYFRVKDEPLVCLASIRDDVDAIDADDPDLGKRHMTFAIMDTYSNETWMGVHSRMPVILRGDQVFRWMWEDLSEDEVREICRPFALDQLVVHEVSDRVLDFDQNDAGLLNPVGEELGE